MKLLVDQNISHRIVPLIEHLFPNTFHVKDLGLVDSNDFEIYRYARQHQFDAVVTLDEDFYILQVKHGIPPKIIWLRTGNCSTKILVEKIISHQNIINDFLNDTAFDYLEIF